MTNSYAHICSRQPLTTVFAHSVCEIRNSSITKYIWMGYLLRKNVNIAWCKKILILYSECCYLGFLALAGGVL